jgi:hypothetical protein
LIRHDVPPARRREGLGLDKDLARKGAARQGQAAEDAQQPLKAGGGRGKRQAVCTGMNGVLAVIMHDAPILPNTRKTKNPVFIRRSSDENGAENGGR